ncbi:hypothetical protein POX_h09465 [Penicillium oxalicum]|uniref:hypothetical protein n=1 Tax=Penicillium oxalicum TaxID=69781 RepID=UPI0020B75382|nr:hypothetical protein POX_h09465 [Penicillium oxalicum]KAI2785707.1 hypothetical protein POX_h09465 [Penicillium oxalicum]
MQWPAQGSGITVLAEGLTWLLGPGTVPTTGARSDLRNEANGWILMEWNILHHLVGGILLDFCRPSIPQIGL